MEQTFGLDIPRTLEEVCNPRRTALLVYDMQVGVIRQIKNRDQIISRVVQVLQAAREAGVRIFFFRHMTLPKELMGVFQVDLGYIPVIVTDACGAGHEDAARRSHQSLEFTGDALITDAETICNFIDDIF